MNKNHIDNEGLIISINRVICAVNKVMEPVFQKKKISITFSQFRILLAISRAKNVSQAMIAEYLEITPATVSRHIENLRAKQFITRDTSVESRRKNILTITEGGKATLANALRIVDSTMHKVLKEVNQSERKSMMDGLDKMFFYLKKATTDLKI